MLHIYSELLIHNIFMCMDDKYEVISVQTHMQYNQCWRLKAISGLNVLI